MYAIRSYYDKPEFSQDFYLAAFTFNRFGYKFFALSKTINRCCVNCSHSIGNGSLDSFNRFIFFGATPKPSASYNFV